MTNLKKIFASLLIVIILFLAINEVSADEQDISVENIETNVNIQEKLNSDMLKSYLTSDEVQFLDNNTVSIKGKFTDYLTINDIIDKIDVVKLAADFPSYNVDAYITTENDVKLENDIPIISNMKLVLSFRNTTNTEDSQQLTYKISVLGDINNDGIVNKLDVDMMIHNILINEEEHSIVDITSLIYAIENQSWDININDDEININDSVSSNTNIYVGDEVIINYAISGLNPNDINGIEGILEYDNNVLELREVLVNGIHEKIGSNNKFLYLLRGLNENTTSITFKFKTIGLGNTSVNLNNLAISVNNKDAKISTTKTVNIEIKNYGTGGDEKPDDNHPDNLHQNSQTTTSSKPALVINNVVNSNSDSNNESNYSPLIYSDIPKTTASQITLSSDNYIKSLKIKGHTIDFDMYKYEYSITVSSKTKSLSLDIILSDEDASYEVIGNEKFKSGKNIVTINVTALDGSTKTYTINVNKEKNSTTNKEKADKENNNSTRIVIIILIILVIIGLIYIIFKDDEEEEANN